MTPPPSKEVWNAWLIACDTDSQVAAIRTLVADYGYTARGAAAVLRWAFGKYAGNPINGRCSWRFQR